VTGKIVSPSLQPVQGAIIGLTPLSVLPRREFSAYSNDLGEFVFDSTPPNRYLLRVRRIGYLQVSDTIQLKSDSGIVASALLIRDPLVLDDCGLTYYEKRVPWWKK
jgi:hypothetical protein